MTKDKDKLEKAEREFEKLQEELNDLFNEEQRIQKEIPYRVMSRKEFEHLEWLLAKSIEIEIPNALETVKKFLGEDKFLFIVRIITEKIDSIQYSPGKVLNLTQKYNSIKALEEFMESEQKRREYLTMCVSWCWTLSVFYQRMYKVADANKNAEKIDQEIKAQEKILEDIKKEKRGK